MRLDRGGGFVLKRRRGGSPKVVDDVKKTALTCERDTPIPLRVHALVGETKKDAWRMGSKGGSRSAKGGKKGCTRGGGVQYGQKRPRLTK